MPPKQRATRPPVVGFYYGRSYDFHDKNVKANPDRKADGKPMTDRKKQIRAGYQKGVKDYDTLLSSRSWWAKLLNKVVWGFPDTEYTEGLLARLPDDFSGRLLDVPVGTGLFTAEKYGRMNQAQVTCLDYSPEMLGKAQVRFSGLSLPAVHFMEGDVGALPFGDGAFHAVLSMNGFHAFPDKEAALLETFRVLRPGGAFLGCFYIRGKTRRTDWVVRNLYVPLGFFTPPFDTESSAREKLLSLYPTVEIWTVGSILCFYCRKGEVWLYD